MGKKVCMLCGKRVPRRYRTGHRESHNSQLQLVSVSFEQASIAARRCCVSFQHLSECFRIPTMALGREPSNSTREREKWALAEKVKLLRRMRAGEVRNGSNW